MWEFNNSKVMYIRQTKQGQKRIYLGDLHRLIIRIIIKLPTTVEIV
jgi:hypothetical protein